MGKATCNCDDDPKYNFCEQYHHVILITILIVFFEGYDKTTYGKKFISVYKNENIDALYTSR